jgi:hypothetical protein
VWVADEGAIENITPFPEGVLLKQVEVWPDPSVYAVVDSSSSTEVELFRGGWSKARRWVKDNLPAPDDADLRQAAKAYAEAVCGEYAKWCSGEVYGCIVQTFNLATESEDGGEPQWVPGDPDRGDQVWGFIGHEYALEALKSEFFDPTVKTLKEVAHA